MKRVALFIVATLLAGRLAAAGSEIRVSLSDAADGGQEVDGGFSAPVSQDVAWRVLTDYNKIPDFISSLKKSEVTGRLGDALFVEQQFSGRFLFFSSTARVLLRIDEEPKRAIRFQDVSGTDFRRYDGFWSISASTDGCRVAYHLEALSRAKAPFTVKRRVLKGGVATLLGEARREMIRRGKEDDRAASLSAVSTFSRPASP